MTPDDTDRTALQIADGEAPDWPDADSPRTDALKALQQIAAAFRQTLPPPIEESRPVLFRWRHLNVVERIGSGSFGDVFRAYDPALQRDVALKLAKKNGSHTGVQQLAASEARSMARLRHPHILAVHGVDTDDGRVGIWADLLQGETLETWLAREGVIPETHLLEISVALTDALTLMHRRGVTHGDLKASNVMVQTDGSPVIVDFGAASAGLERSPRAGSPLAMAPEQFAGGPISSAADVYALGVLIYRARTGRYPLVSDSLEDLRDLHDRAVAPSWENIDRHWRQLLQGCLNHDPKRRPSASDLLTQLRAIRQAPERRRRRLAAAGIFAILVVGLAGTSYGLLRATRAERAATEQALQTETTFDFLADMLQAPRTGASEVRVRDVLANAEQGLNDGALTQAQEARLRWVLGRTYGSLSLYDEANDQLDRAAKMAADPRLRLAIWVTHGDVALHARDFERAQRVMTAFESLRPTLPPELDYARHHPTLIEALVAQGSGRHAEAEELLKQIDQAPQGFPPDHAANREVWRNLSTLAGRRGDLKGSQIYIKKALEWLERHGQGNLEAIANVRNDLATVQCRLQEYALCESTSRENLALLEEHRPDDSAGKLASLNAIAMALSGQGKNEAAMEASLRVKDEAEKNLGPNHPHTILALGNVGYASYVMGRYAETEQWSRAAVERAAAAQRSDTATALMFEGNLAEAVLLQGRSEEGLRLAKTSYDRCLEHLGADHTLTVDAADIYALALARTGQAQAAMALVDENAAKRRELYGPDDDSIWQTRAVGAEALFATGELNDALQLASEVLTHRRATLSPADSKVSQAEALVQRIQSARTPSPSTAD